jgi:hypothetical protein
MVTKINCLNILYKISALSDYPAQLIEIKFFLALFILYVINLCYSIVSIQKEKK